MSDAPHNRVRATAIRPHLRGLTLVELMVALVLGLLLIGGIINVFLGTQQTHRTQEAMSRVQEAGRFAVEMLAHEARQAGFSACAGMRMNNLLDQNDPGYDPAVHAARDAFSFVPEPAAHLRGDVLAVNRMRTLSTGRDAGTGDPANPQDVPPIVLDGASGVEQGTIVMVSSPDGTGCDLFQQTTTDTADDLQRAAGGGTPGNITAAQAQYTAFDGPVDISLAERSVYFIGDSAFNPGVSSLFRMRVTDGNTPREIVEGVYDMYVEYGEDTNDDGWVDTYIPHRSLDATSDWSRFAAVRVQFLVYSGAQDNVVDEPRANILFGGQFVDAPDRRLYQAFTTTIAARNRLR